MHGYTHRSPVVAVLVIVTAAALGGCSSNTSITVNVNYSGDASADGSGENTAEYTVVSSTATAKQVAAPNYTGVDRIAVQIDARDRVSTVGGGLDLTDGSVPGEDYVIDLGTLPVSPTFAEVDSVFSAGTKVLVAPNAVIAGSSFLQVGDDLTTPLARAAILHHEVSGVSSYQIFTITFHS
jgi:hypothetical protein